MDLSGMYFEYCIILNVHLIITVYKYLYMKLNLESLMKIYNVFYLITKKNYNYILLFFFKKKVNHCLG